LKIYVVKSGDSVWSIARTFGVNPQDIISANGISSSSTLVVGQSLIIPTKEKAYRVKPGENIWIIARRFGVSVEGIASLNGIPSPYSIYPGSILRIPEKAKNYGYIEANGFIQPSTPDKERRVLSQSIQYLTYVTPFSHHVNPDASLTPLEDTTIREVTRNNKVATMLSVTNISGANFDTNLINNILNDDVLQQKLISNMLELLSGKGYYGVIIDFERIPPEDRQKYNNFLRKVVARLHPTYVVVTALAPKTYDVTSGAWHGYHVN
jgi:spore germination protein